MMLDPTRIRDIQLSFKDWMELTLTHYSKQEIGEALSRYLIDGRIQALQAQNNWPNKERTV